MAVTSRRAAIAVQGQALDRRPVHENLGRPAGVGCYPEMTGYYCNCGLYTRTLVGLRKHTQTCAQAAAKLRAAEDHARVDRINRAKKINDAAREDAWQRILERP
jgi:hypothetical protein